MSKWRLLWVALIALLPPALMAGDARPFRDLPTLDLKIHQSSPAITAPMDAEITFTNLTNRTYDIRAVRLHIPQGVVVLRDHFSGEITKEVHAVRDGSERIYALDIPQVEMPFWATLWDRHTLLFIPGKYRFRAEVEMYDSTDKNSVQTLYASLDVPLEPPLSAILRGGIIGALLLALFVPAYRVLQAAREERAVPSWRLLWNGLAQFMVYALAGSVVAVTVILFIYRMGSANLPITIALNDYLGGVIVGLFSYLFGDALYKRLFDIPSKTDPG